MEKLVKRGWDFAVGRKSLDRGLWSCVHASATRLMILDFGLGIFSVMGSHFPFCSGMRPKLDGDARLLAMHSDDAMQSNRGKCVPGYRPAD